VVQLQTFFTSALDGGQWSWSTHWLQMWSRGSGGGEF